MSDEAPVVPTAAELQQEEAAKHVPTMDEIRAEVIADTGFDPEGDKEKIENLTKKSYEQRLKTSEAIGAKIKHRNEATDLRGKVAATPAAPNTLSTADILTLSSANLHPEDAQEAFKFMTLNKLSLGETLKNPMFSAYLQQQVSKRTTAQATDMGGARGAAAESGEALLKKAETTGEVPETTEGMQALFSARQDRRKNKFGKK